MDYRHQLVGHYGNGEGNALYRMVMEECFSFSQTDILLGKDKHLSREDQQKLDEIVSRLLKNEPIQYILGYADFCGHRFEVRKGCLIPRPETEELVRLIVADYTKAKVLDIGTGSGCIAISLALAGFDVTATDISSEALDIAEENAERLGARVDFRQEDILLTSKHANTQISKPQMWDIIVSNPPYICEREVSDMCNNVLDFEPHEALFVPDNDPLLFYRAIARYGREYLNEGGALYFEINHSFGSEMKELLTAEEYHDIIIRKDQYGKERIAKAYV